MALTEAQKLGAARAFIRREYADKNKSADLNKDDLLTAIDEVATLLDSAGTRTAVDNALSEPAKSTATLVQKSGLIVVAAEALAGRFD